MILDIYSFFFLNKSCEKCDKRFAKSHHLKVHYKTHEKRLAKLNQLPQPLPLISPPPEEKSLIQPSTSKRERNKIKSSSISSSALLSATTSSKSIKQEYLSSNIDKQHVLLSQNGQFVASESVFKDVMSIISSSTTNTDDYIDYIEECVDDDGVDVCDSIIDNNSEDVNDDDI